MYTSVCDPALTVQKFIAYESSRMAEYGIFTRAEISARAALMYMLGHMRNGC